MYATSAAPEMMSISEALRTVVMLLFELNDCLVVDGCGGSGLAHKLPA